MLRKYSEVFRTLCAVADLTIVATALLVAFLIRFHSGWLAGWLPTPLGTPEPKHYGNLALVAVPVFALLLVTHGLYRPRRGRSRMGEARTLVQVGALGTLCVAAASFFWNELAISRATVGIFGILATCGLIAFRLCMRSLLSVARRLGYNQRDVLIVGTGTLAQEVYLRLMAHPDTGLHIVGSLGPLRRGRPLPEVLGPYEHLHDIVTRRHIDQVVIALDRSDPTDPTKLIEALGDTTATVRIAPDLLGLPTMNVASEDLDGLPLICLVETRILGWNSVLKRALDLAIAIPALLVLSPVLALIGCAVKLTSPDGPILYRQQRMSLDGKLFSMLKFRTMVPNAEAETGPCWAQPNDSRRTPIGGVLRRLNLDELPQLWNIVLGDMSLVGPRPERPELIEEFRRQHPGYMRRHKIKGGLTGLAQVSGYRGNTSLARRLELDMDYARNWSLWLDIKIIALTAARSFRDPNAY